MPYPRPVTGLVIRYAYLWRNDFKKGKEEGVKDRPCAVILVTQDVDGKDAVTVLPVTHKPPHNLATALEIPSAVKRRLSLDSERSWVVLDEANQFIWPGPDLRPAIADNMDSVAYGVLPARFVQEIRTRFVANLRAGRGRTVPRSE
jgi:hypothetical protein